MEIDLDGISPRQFSSVMLILLVSSTALTALKPVKAVSNEGYYHREFEWNYAGLRWTWSLDIAKALYNTYEDVSVSERVRQGPEGYGFLVTTRDSYMVQLANKLHDGAVKKGYEAYDEVSYILAFVQSLPYTSDSVTTTHDEYPRFPVETLVDGGGDCEDTSILFATITLILNYDTIFISPPDHYAVGIWGKNLVGSYYTYNNRTYYYCETTGDGWKIGQIPNEFKSVSAHLYTIDRNMQYDPNQDVPADGVPDQTHPSFSDPFVSFLLFIGLIVAISGASYVLTRRKREHEAEEAPPQPPPTPADASAY